MEYPKCILSPAMLLIFVDYFVSATNAEKVNHNVFLLVGICM